MTNTIIHIKIYKNVPENIKEKDINKYIYSKRSAIISENIMNLEEDNTTNKAINQLKFDINQITKDINNEKRKWKMKN